MEMAAGESKCCGIVASGSRQCVCALSTFSSVHSPALPHISNSPTWSGHPLPPEDSRNVERNGQHSYFEFQSRPLKLFCFKKLHFRKIEA